MFTKKEKSTGVICHWLFIYETMCYSVVEISYIITVILFVTVMGQFLLYYYCFFIQSDLCLVSRSMVYNLLYLRTHVTSSPCILSLMQSQDAQLRENTSPSLATLMS